MDMTDLERAFVEVTRRYLIEHSEACLVEAAEIGRKAVMKDTPIENMADVFEAALVELVREFPSRALKDAVGVVSPLLAEVLIGFGLAFRENQARLEADALLFDQFNFLNAMIEAMPAPVFYKNREGTFLGLRHRAARVGFDVSAVRRYRLYDAEAADPRFHQNHARRQPALPANLSGSFRQG